MDLRMAQVSGIVPYAQHRIFFIFRTQKAHIEHDNHSTQTSSAKKVHAQTEVNEK